MNMRLLGARNIKEVVAEMVDASNIHLHMVSVPTDNLYERNCALVLFLWFSNFNSTIDERLQGARLREVKNKL